MRLREAGKGGRMITDKKKGERAGKGKTRSNGTNANTRRKNNIRNTAIRACASRRTGPQEGSEGTVGRRS